MSVEPESAARKASETSFPYGSKLVCYFAVEDGHAPVQLRYVGDKAFALLRAHKGEVAIYAVWPGQHRSDLFIMDDLKPLAVAWKAPLESPLNELQLKHSRLMLAEGKHFDEIAAMWRVPTSTVSEALAV